MSVFPKKIARLISVAVAGAQLALERPSLVTVSWTQWTDDSLT